jgi:hypothetical protein
MNLDFNTIFYGVILVFSCTLAGCLSIVFSLWVFDKVIK